MLLTAAGSPGAATCIRYLKQIRERQVRVVGADVNAEAIGRHLCDAFEPIPAADSDGYIDALLDLAQRHEVDCLIPASSYEVNVVAAAVDRFAEASIRVLVSDLRDLEVAGNKRLLYEKFRDHRDVSIPKFRVVRSLDEFLAAYEELDGAHRPLCFKAPCSKGSRSFRYINDSISRRDMLLNYKPDSKYISLAEFIEIFREEQEFPELLLMEVLAGEAIDSMVLALDGQCLLITHKTRERERGGVITEGQQVSRPELDRAIRAIVAEVPLKYNFGIQFIGIGLVEINPRLSTFLYQNDWVEPYFAIKLALGEFTTDDVRALQKKVPLGLRMVRYFDQYFYRPTD